MSGDVEPNQAFLKSTMLDFIQVLGLTMGKEQYHDYLEMMHDSITEAMIIEAMPMITVHEKQVRQLEVNSLPDVPDGWEFPLLDGVIIYDSEPPAERDSTTTRRTSVTRGKNPVRKKHTRTGNAQ